MVEYQNEIIAKAKRTYDIAVLQAQEKCQKTIAKAKKRLDRVIAKEEKKNKEGSNARISE